MAVADIIYFATIVSAALVSAVVLLRQFFRGDVVGIATNVPQYKAAPPPAAPTKRVHRPRAA